MSFGTLGDKPRWAREIDTDNPQDMLNLTAAQAANIAVFSGKAVTDENGNRQIIIEAVATASTINLTDYANFGIGSIIIHTGAAAPTLYIKVAKSTIPVAGDWYKQQLTVCT
jgi:hypothetical protein